MPLAPEMMSDMVFLNCNFILLKKYPGTLKIEIKSNYKILYYKYIKFNTLNVNQNIMIILHIYICKIICVYKHMHAHIYAYFRVSVQLYSLS